MRQGGSCADQYPPDQIIAPRAACDTDRCADVSQSPQVNPTALLLDHYCCQNGLRAVKEIHLETYTPGVVKLLHRAEPRCSFNPPPREKSHAKQKAEKIPDLHREDPLMTQQRQETGSVTPDPFGGILLHSKS